MNASVNEHDEYMHYKICRLALSIFKQQCLGCVCLVVYTNKHDLRWFEDHYRLNTEWAFVVVKSDREYYNNEENSNVFNTSQYLMQYKNYYNKWTVKLYCETMNTIH